MKKFWLMLLLPLSVGLGAQTQDQTTAPPAETSIKVEPSTKVNYPKKEDILNPVKPEPAKPLPPTDAKSGPVPQTPAKPPVTQAPNPKPITPAVDGPQVLPPGWFIQIFLPLVQVKPETLDSLAKALPTIQIYHQKTADSQYFWLGPIKPGEVSGLIKILKSLGYLSPALYRN